MKIIETSKDIESKRLDVALTNIFSSRSRSYFSELIKNGGVTINRNKVKPSYKLIPGDIIEILENIEEQKPSTEIKPEKIPLDIIYEDDNVIVINKQPGLVVHPASGTYSNTLVNALLDYFPKIREAVYQKGNPVSEARPGLVHRLDKNTSGLIIVAKNKKAMHSLSMQIKNRTVIKKYIALCFGWPKNESGTLISYLGRHPKNRKYIADIGKEKGKEAISDYKLLDCYTYNSEKLSLIEFRIHTGRTHQIRVQAKQLGNPVMGDEFYGSKDSMNLSQKLKVSRQMLHAQTLIITLPNKNKPDQFTAPIPDDMQEILTKLKLADL